MNQIKDLLEYLFNAIKIWVIVQKWESGIRVRCGKRIKKLKPGIHFKLPYFDSVYVLETRLRVKSLPIQTLTTLDLKTLTLDGAIGYEVTDVEVLFNKIFAPETTIGNIAMAAASDFVYKSNLSEVTPAAIEKHVVEALNKDNYGLRYKYFKITNFAVVRTYRLIQDTTWHHNGLNMTNKK